MEYRWTPESHLATQYGYLNPSLDEEGRRRQQAQIFVDEKDYERAADAYREILDGAPEDGASWLQLGRIHHETKRYAEAIEAYRSAAALPAVRAIALYNLACAHARNRETDRAIEVLAEFYEAAASNRPPREVVLGDPDFESIRQDDRFVKLVDRGD
ncbi:MAG: tetratricopeptide repeat protein [Acidobacteria bacterium]|nr:tetratricopeptide repeat protein [Acidobacteriota bacterium]